jgi:hypothetical protein
MKKIQYLTLIVASAFAVFSCDEDSEGVSRITHYPVITLNGDDQLFIDKGAEYTEPGGVALEGESEITLDVDYTGTYFTGPVSNIDTSIPDVYSATYTAINKDGFPGVATRTIYVAGQGDLTTNLEGLYTATVVRNGVVSPQYQNLEYVIIAKTGANTYQLSDGIAGYYDLGRLYGPGYAALDATFTANNIATDNFTFGPAFGVGAFGGVATITSMDVNEVTKTIHYVVEWDAGPYTFDITLKQVQF